VACERDDFDDFFREDLPRLVKFLINAGFDYESSRDAAAEAMLSAHLGWADLRNPRAYVRTAALHEAGNQAKRDRARTVRSIKGGWVTSERIDPFAEIDDDLDGQPRLTALLQLLPQQQRLVLAWHLDGFTNTEIAGQLDMNPATVGSHLRHAKQRLKAHLASTGSLSAIALEGGVHDDA
jgi:RNA polymerase sigma-70 factor (ECF subfamily)